MCAACGKLHGYCSEVGAQLTGVTDHAGSIITNPGINYDDWLEKNNMIPRGNNNNEQSNQRGKRKGSGLRYLSADMLSTTHQAAGIIDARVESDSFRQGQTVVTVKIKFKGEFLLWSLRPGNPSLDTLGDALGDDETTWKGHDIELYIEEDSFNGKKWIRSEVLPATTTKRGK